MTLLERFDALCEQFRSAPDDAERELLLRRFACDEYYECQQEEERFMRERLDAMTAVDFQELMPEPRPSPPRRCRPAREPAQILAELGELRLHRWWFGKWNQERQRVAAIDKLKRRLRSAGTPIPRPRYLRPAERASRQRC
jgi:hypothetical protein